MTLPLAEKGYQNPNAGLWWPSLDDEETPELIWPRSVAVYDRMRRQDAQVMSVLRAVTLPIRRTTWRIDPSGCRPEVAQLVSDDLGLPLLGEEPKPVTRTKGRFSWVEHLRLALLMLPHGHSVFEQQAKIVNGQARLSKLAWRPPRTISAFDVADDGGLVAIEQHQLTGTQTARMDVSRLAVYCNEREGGAWTGTSLLRPAYKFWLLKDRALRTQAQTLDRNGLGIPVYTGGEYSDDLDPNDRRAREKQEIEAGAAMAAAVRAGDNSGVAIRNKATLELKGVQGTLPAADPVIRYYDEQIARAVLAHFLNLGTETGSWALGSTFADFFTLSLQTVAQQVAETASQHVVEDMVDWNWGEEEPAPRVVFDEIGSRHPATADAIKMLIDCGAITADEDLEQFLRTMHGLPAADQSTRRETKAPALTLTAPPAPGPAPAQPSGRPHA